MFICECVRVIVCEGDDLCGRMPMEKERKMIDVGGEEKKHGTAILLQNERRTTFL